MPADASTETWPDREHLRNSRQIVWERFPATPAAVDAVGAFTVELEAEETRKRRRSGDARRRLQDCLGAVLMDLLLLDQEAPGRWLTIAGNQTAYAGAAERYLPNYVSYRNVRAVTRFLEAKNYVEVRPGSFRRFGFTPTSGVGYRSRYRPTPLLRDRMARLGVTSADAGTRETTEVIRLKGPPETSRGAKPLIRYEDTADTVRWREAIRAWHVVARDHHIVLPRSRPAHIEAGEGEAADGGIGGDPHSIQLYRVFNDGRWDRGGRFYGGWQNLPKAERAKITIDGEPVVELDFKAMHPRLAYHLSGLGLPSEVDPYAIPGLPPGVTRDHVKVAFNQLLASRPGGRIRRPDDATIPRNVPWPKVLKAVADHHAPIAGRWFRQARALDLQWVDSEVAERVLGYFTAAIRRPVLPVHDSFIVAASDEAKLGETMMLAYRGFLNVRLGREVWPVIDGWTSTRVRDEVTARVGATTLKREQERDRAA